MYIYNHFTIYMTLWLRQRLQFCSVAGEHSMHLPQTWWGHLRRKLLLRSAAMTQGTLLRFLLQ
jgi:hypothetical protein